MPTGFDHYSVMWGQGSYFDPKFIEPSEHGPVWKESQGYSTDLVTDKCLDWLKGRDSEKPFMLLCHFKSPYYNWEPDEKHKAMFEDETIPEPETFDHDFGDSPVPPEALQVKLETVHEQWNITHWDAMPEGLSMQDQKHRNYQYFIKDYLRCEMIILGGCSTTSTNRAWPKIRLWYIPQTTGCFRANMAGSIKK